MKDNSKKVLCTSYRSIRVSWLSTDQVGLSNNNPYLNFRFLFLLINGQLPYRVSPYFLYPYRVSPNFLCSVTPGNCSLLGNDSTITRNRTNVFWCPVTAEIHCQDSANTFSKKSSSHLTCCAPTLVMSFFCILFIQPLVCLRNNFPGECMTMCQSSILLSKNSSLAHTHRCLTHARSYDKDLPKDRIIHNNWRNIIPDKLLTPTFYKPVSSSTQSGRCHDMDTLHRHYLVFCRSSCERGFLTTLPKNAFDEDHTMLVVILCTVRQSFPCQLFFKCWGPCVILH